MMANHEITVQQSGAVAVLSFTGEDGILLTEAALAELSARLTGLADDASVHVVVLRGAAGVLCTNWHPDDVARATSDAATLQRLTALMQSVAECPLPVIAALEGDVSDAGLELALACDVRLAARDTTFGLSGGATGVPPLAGGVARLVRLAGRSAALRLLLTGESIGAGEALACGLVSDVYPEAELHDEARRLASVIASRGPISTRYAKEAVSRGTEMPLDQALRFETDLTIILQSTADRAEGIAAFAEKRTPRFRGQ